MTWIGGVAHARVWPWTVRYQVTLERPHRCIEWIAGTADAEPKRLCFLPAQAIVGRLPPRQAAQVSTV